MSLRIARVEVYGDGDTPAMELAVVLDEAPRSVLEMSEIALNSGVARTVFALPPRRDDCVLRARTFTPSRELPRSAEAALALTLLRGEGLTLEEGVTATRTGMAHEGWVRVEAPPPVVGSRDLDDPRLAAEALGLSLDELDPARAPRAASCGPNVMVVPLRSAEALRAARLDLESWRTLVGKAKHHGALALFVTAGREVLARSLTPDPALSEERGNGLAAVAAARSLCVGVTGAAPVDFCFGGAEGWRARLAVISPESENPWISARVRVLNA